MGFCLFVVVDFWGFVLHDELILSEMYMYTPIGLIPHWDN